MPRNELAACLDAKVKLGRLKRSQAEAALREVTEQEQELARYNALGEAGRKAEHQVAARLEARARRKEIEQAKHLLALKKALAAAEAHPDGVGAGVRGLLDIVTHSNAANVASRASTLRGLFHAFFESGIQALRPRLFGLIMKRRSMDDFLRATFGETVGAGGRRLDPDAAALAKAWRETTDLSLELANKAGADIRTRTDWHVPQKFDPKKLKAQGYAGFRSDLGGRFERLARDRMLHWETGQPLTDAELEVTLPQIYEALVSRGLSEIVPGADPTMAAPVAKLNHHRFLQFKTAADWMMFHGKYGRGSIYGTVMGHLDFMAREVATLQILGPKHNQVMRQLVDRARLDQARSEKRTRMADQPWALEAIYNKQTGVLDRWDDAQFPTLLKGVEETRGYLAAFQLGSAIFSAVSDLKTFSRTAAWNGLGRWRAFGELLKQYNPASSRDRRWAIRRGLIAENATNIAFSANRFQDRVSEGGAGAWLASVTTTITGLNGHTQAMRHAFGMEFLATLTEHAELPLERLPKPLRETFEAHRISAADWEVIRSTPRVEPEAGADFLDPLEIMKRTDIGRDQALDVSQRLLDMINEEKDLAVIVKRPTSEVLTTFGTERKTVAGQLMRSFGMYKNFAITWTLLHGQRARAVGGWAGAGYIAELFIGMTLLGAVGMTLRDLSKGKDPRDATDPSFWLAAAFQGGGLGVLGDFAYSLTKSGVSRHGHDPFTALGGPVAGLFSDTVKLGASNANQALEGKPTNIGREAVRFAQRHNPAASWWYARTALDRLLWDTLQAEVDPDYRTSQRNMEKRAAQDFGQGFWWRPGRTAPDRAPDLGAIAGGG